MVKGTKLKDDEDDTRWEAENKLFWVDEFLGIENQKRGLMDDLYDFEKLIEFYKNYLVKEIEKVQKKFKESEEGYYDDNLYDLNSIMNIKRLTLISTFISLHSIFESKLKDFCKYIQEYQPLEKGSLTIPNEDIIEACIAYLIKRLPNIHQSIQKSFRAERIGFNHLRNKLVHNNGIINKKTEKAQYSKISKMNYVQLVPIRRENEETFLIVFKSDLVLSYLNLIKGQFKILEKEVKNVFS